MPVCEESILFKTCQHGSCLHSELGQGVSSRHDWMQCDGTHLWTCPQRLLCRLLGSIGSRPWAGFSWVHSDPRSMCRCLLPSGVGSRETLASTLGDPGTVLHTTSSSDFPSTPLIVCVPMDVMRSLACSFACGTRARVSVVPPGEDKVMGERQAPPFLVSSSACMSPCLRIGSLACQGRGSCIGLPLLGTMSPPLLAVAHHWSRHQLSPLSLEC